MDLLLLIVKDIINIYYLYINIIFHTTEINSYKPYKQRLFGFSIIFKRIKGPWNQKVETS